MIEVILEKVVLRQISNVRGLDVRDVGGGKDADVHGRREVWTPQKCIFPFLVALSSELNLDAQRLRLPTYGVFVFAWDLHVFGIKPRDLGPRGHSAEATSCQASKGELKAQWPRRVEDSFRHINLGPSLSSASYQLLNIPML